MTVRDITIKFVTYLMIGIMGMFIANKAVFLHVHKLDDGTIIKHAHPYDKSKDSEPYKSHKHTNTELLFFQNLELLFLIIFTTFTLLTLAKKAKVVFQLAIWPTINYINLNQGRAPPIL